MAGVRSPTQPAALHRFEPLHRPEYGGSGAAAEESHFLGEDSNRIQLASCPSAGAREVNSASVPRASKLCLLSWRYSALPHLPRAVVELSQHANRVVNVVKARDGLRGKSEALEAIVTAYEEAVLDPSLRPEFIADLERIRGGRFRRVGSMSALLGAST